MGRALGELGRIEDFNVRPDHRWEVFTPRGGESRKLRFAVDPDVKKMIRRQPETLELLYEREVLAWMGHMGRQGYRLVSKPSPPSRRPSPDPTQRGWDWYIVEARWAHDGPVQMLMQEDYEAKREEERRIGAGQLKSQSGVAILLQEHDGVPEGVEIFGDPSLS